MEIIFISNIFEIFFNKFNILNNNILNIYNIEISISIFFNRFNFNNRFIKIDFDNI